MIDRKITLNDGGIVQAVVWELPVPLSGYKYRLYFGRDGACLVRYDNEQGKGDHHHIAGGEQPYNFTDIPTLLSDFRQSIRDTGTNV